jgi:GTP-binding protein Era
MKSAFVAVIGRPSSGKSSILNAVCGHKVSITSPTPQTTRNKIRGIYTESRGQLVFLDTPGFHLSEKKFNRKMVELIQNTLEEVDLVLYVMDAGRPPGPEEEKIAAALVPYQEQVVIGCNKQDLPENAAAQIREFIDTRLPSCKLQETSAVTGNGLPELISALFELAPEGELMYPEEFYTDQDPEFRASEIIREKALRRVRQEVPHALYVEISDMEVQGEGEPATLWIRAFLMVERESQKGILIGKGGRIIKEIRSEAQKELEELFPYRIRLDLRVKVNRNWRKNDMLLKKLIR